MPYPNTLNDTALLAAALKGLELQKSRIEEQINHLRSLMDGSAPHRGSKGNPPGAITDGFEPAVRKRRPLSAAALRRISAAQKKRWAKYRAAGGKQRNKKPAR